MHQIDLNLKSLVISPHFHEIECNPPSNIRRSSNAGWSWIFPLFTAGSGCVVAGRLSHKTLGLVLSSHNYTANIVLVWLPVTRELSQPAGSGRDWSHSLGLCCASLWSSHSSHTPSLPASHTWSSFYSFQSLFWSWFTLCVPCRLTYTSSAGATWAVLASSTCLWSLLSSSNRSFDRTSRLLLSRGNPIKLL